MTETTVKKDITFAEIEELKHQVIKFIRYAKEKRNGKVQNDI